ncbi:hypothetical protein [Streptomyces sp. S1D4-14]|uniref:hypothetical protein n=1 Tax=Streptomyces sp. S1D4-14 TaxID=2594461 RepID=UPI0011626EA5|nr:hypothetical protein [Streptomyces sp. S1D4-14]QDN64486.1 hypothetical protein FNV66_01235 [Streptomyces sp. S1D4-14]
MQPKQTPVRTAALTVSVSTVRATVTHRDGVEAYYVTVVVDDTPTQRHQGKAYAGWTVGETSLRAETSGDAARIHGDAVDALYGVTQA